MIDETRKILSLPELPVTATTVRYTYIYWCSMGTARASM